MKKERIGIIGYGRWAKVMVPTINKYFKIDFIITSNFNYKLIDLKKIKWIFVITNNQSHYEIVKYFLKKKINVFCEKPLTQSLKLSKELYALRDKYKTKLYVNDVEFFKNKSIILKKKNIIQRQKKSDESKISLLFRLAYHDFYLLKDKINLKKIKDIKIFETKKKLNIFFIVERQTFEFLYRIDSLNKIHKINSLNLLRIKKKPLDIMFKKLSRNEINFYENKNRTLFSSEIISILQKKYV